MALPLTVAGEVVVIGPRFGPERKHAALVERAVQWHGTPGWSAAPDRVAGTPAPSDGTAVQQAIQHLRQATPGSAAIVDRRKQRTVHLRLPGTGRMRWTGIRSLSDVPPASPGNRTVPPEALARLTNPGSGLFAPVVGEPPPIGGTATARLHIIGSPAQLSLGWAQDSASAYARALLAGLRVLSTRLAPTASHGRMLVGAAGASELQWLLDGGLRLLSAYGTGSEQWPATDKTLQVVVNRVPHLDNEWRIARVFGVSSGAPVAAAWGRTAPEAVGHALTQARVRLAASVPGMVCDPRHPAADPMMQELSVAELSGLRQDVQRCLGRLRFRLLGVRIETDALLGDPGLAWGVVWWA